MPHETPPPTLILASSSPYREELLARLGVSFETISPHVEEMPERGESASELATRLAIEKASAVAARHPDAFVLGSDQVAVHNDQIVSKPGSGANARQQLARYSGQLVEFLSAVALVRDSEVRGIALVETRVSFRSLTDSEIARYVEADRPIDCAGSFRAEGLGPSLFESAFSQDPTALIGLPLIETARLLREAGFQVP